MWTAWDGRAFWRAVGTALVALALAWLVTAATDEGNVAWAERLARALAVAPLASAIGAWAALAPGRLRGELRALAALGRTPWQNARAAVLGAASVCAVAAAAIGWGPPAEAEAFYPEITHAQAFAFDDGAFVDRANGWKISTEGDITRVPAAPALGEARLPRFGRAAAGLATLAAGMALALVSANEARRARWLAASLVVLALTLVLFQAAAVRLLPALTAALPPLALLGAAARRYKSVP
jgi:hypothetical protein